jgi:hypothetical protein
MQTEEFDHYFRICLDRTLSSEEAREFLFAVNDIAAAEADPDDVVMYYHTEDNRHCYDIRLATDITGEQGDQILEVVEELFPNDDFECESSMDSVSETHYLNRAILEQLSKI